MLTGYYYYQYATCRSCTGVVRTMTQRRIWKVKEIRHVRCERWWDQPSASGMSRQPLPSCHTQRHTLPEPRQCFCKNETHAHTRHSVEQLSFADCVHLPSTADNRNDLPTTLRSTARTRGNWTVIMKQIFRTDIDCMSHELLSLKSAFTLSRGKLKPIDSDVHASSDFQ